MGKVIKSIKGSSYLLCLKVLTKMRGSSHTILLIMFMNLICIGTYAYDITIDSGDGVTFYYNLRNNGKELGLDYLYLQYNCRDVVIPEEVTYLNRTRKVTSIGENAFTSLNCGNITSVTIPKSISSIGGNAFFGCGGLTSVCISDLTAWCNIDFGINISNPLYKAQHLYLDGKEIKDLVIPNGVTNICNKAFQGCSGLTSLTIPNTVTTIGDFAFSDCLNLTSVSIPNSVSSIGGCAFMGCECLGSVTIPSSVISIGSSAFQNCKELSNVIISDGVEKIGNSVFNSCEALKTVTIPNSVTMIGDRTFENCTGLTSVNISKNIKKIGDYAFASCNGLTSINIPNNVTTIGNYAFAWCYKIRTLIIPNSVITIGSNAFKSCISLETVTISASVMSIGPNAFDGENLSTVVSLIENPCEIYGKFSDKRVFTLDTFNNASLYVPLGTIDKYMNTNCWNNFVFIEEMIDTMVGDVNGDNVVNAADIVELVNAFKGNPSANYKTNNADLNGDNEINEEDIEAIVNLIMKK